MGNYAITDKVGLPSLLRVRNNELLNSYFEHEKITISPSYVFNDNSFRFIEYSTYDDGVATPESNDLFAVELIYTF